MRPCSLTVGCLTWGDAALEPVGCLVGLMVASRKASPVSASQTCSGSFCPHLVPQLPQQLCRPTSASRQIWPSHWWHDYLFSCVLLHKIPCVSSKSGVSFSPGSESPAVRSLWPSKSDSLQTLVAQPAGLGHAVRLSTFSPVGELNVCSCFPFCAGPQSVGYGTGTDHGCTSYHLPWLPLCPWM